MRRVLLIARREILAYAAIPSFWVALALGPLLMALAALAVGAASRPPAAPPPRMVIIEAPDAALKDAAAKALADAAALEGRALAVLQPQPHAPAEATRLDLGSDRAGRVVARVAGAPLSPAAEALLKRDLQSAARRELAREAGAPQAALMAGDQAQVEVEVPPAAAAAAGAPADLARFGRFAVVVLLWMNLVGALGMLLQAIVRERANRALESLLASARASEIIFGKLCGIGGLSLFVLAVWLGSGALIAATPLAASGAGIAGQVLGAFADLRALALAVVLFVGAFAMYGAGLIGLGALARDVPAAQNLSRPVFGVLLLVFFVGLAQLSGASGAESAWLAWIPLFTPFVLLMAEPGSIGPVTLAAGVIGMAAVTVACGRLASRALQDQPLLPALAWRRRGSPASARA